MIKTFISHASEDHGFVNWLKVKLDRDNLGLDIFVDDGSVFVGDNAQKMINEVKKSIIFIPIFSSASVQKEFVLNETKTALHNATTHVFPIKYKCNSEDIPQEIRIRFSTFDNVKGKIYEDFSNEKEWEIHFDNLRRAIFDKILELRLLKEKDKDFYQDCQHLDIILSRDEPTTQEIKLVIDVYFKKEEYQRYFFSRLDNLRWLNYLRIYGFFKFNPKPVEAKDAPGYFTIPHWYVLDYLEKVSKQLENNQEETISQLLEIIRETSNFKDENGQHIDNYRTWWYFVKILLNIPNNKIPFDVIQLIPVWLESKFDNRLPANDIATKLLPKLLDSENPDDWKKAEEIVKSITKVKLEENKEDWFGKEKKSKTLVDSHLLLDAFRENAKKAGEKCSENVIFTIADNLKEIFRGEYPQHHLDVEHQSKYYRISVTQEKEFEFNISIDEILDVDAESLKPEERIFKGIRVKTKNLYGDEIKDCTDRGSFMSRLKEKLNQLPELKQMDSSLHEKLANLYTGIFSDHSYVWFKSIATGSGLSFYDARQILTLILRDICVAKVEKDSNTAQSIFNKFLGPEYQYPLFRRIVLFLIGKEWDDFKETFWQIVEQEGGFLFENPNFKFEIFPLLKDNAEKLVTEEKERLKKIIERGPQKYLPEDNRERYISHWKQECYLALKSDPDFKTLYEEQRKITKREAEIPVPVRFESRVGAGSSPLPKEDILRMSNEELVAFMKTFKTVDHWEGPSVEALSLTLKDAVQEKPEKFIENLTPFLNAGYLYVYRILYGIKDAWNQKKTIDWEKLLKFIKQYIDRNDFWQGKFKIQDDGLGAVHGWATGTIGELIQDGTKDDAWAFSKEYLPLAQDILFLILKKQKPEKEEFGEAVTHALNSPHGKVITALILLALRIARIECKKGVKREIKWSQTVRVEYEKLLEKNIIEAFTLFGQYMANFYYLDKEWVKQRIREIGLAQNEKTWKSFMGGYLLAGPIYPYLCDLMKDHYFAAIEYNFEEEFTNRQLVDHISLQYLHGKESIDDTKGLFRRLLDIWNPSQIEAMISFFWVQRENVGENPTEEAKAKMAQELSKKIDRIIDFWRWTYENKYKNRYYDELNKEDKWILSNLSLLTALLSKVDNENKHWLMACAPYVDVDFQSSFFIEYLDNLKDRDKQTTKYVGQIFVKMLENATPEYDQKHISSIVEYLYEAGEKDSADMICNTYGSRGRDFLRHLWVKYQKNNS